jgi:cytochrome c oxidase subunit 2
MRKEVLARLTLLLSLSLAVGIPAGAFWAYARTNPNLNAAPSTIELRARMPEAGGWSPANLTATVGQPLRLRLISDDVVHGFVVGQSDWPPAEIRPGEVTEVTLLFDHPGTYTFYCDRWCGPNHWRMRGTIEVSAAPQPAAATMPVTRPLFVTLGIDLDAPHPADVIPEQKPSAARGAALGIAILNQYLRRDYYRVHSPVALWHALRTEKVTQGLTDQQVWDIVALVWRSNAAPEVLQADWKGYAQNCAACHGEAGQGNGVLAPTPAPMAIDMGAGSKKPVDFTDMRQMLGASPALLQGKLIRGGMGTGMPSWGAIFTEAQSWAYVDYLWTFQFEYALQK